MPQVSLLATLLATVLSFVLGGLWYGPLFGKTWMRLVGMTEVGMFLGPNPSLALGVGAGAAAGIFWVAGSLWTNDLFERRPFALTMINGGYHIVKFVLIGLSYALL